MNIYRDFSAGPVVKNLPCNAGVDKHATRSRRLYTYIHELTSPLFHCNTQQQHFLRIIASGVTPNFNSPSADSVVSTVLGTEDRRELGYSLYLLGVTCIQRY